MKAAPVDHYHRLDVVAERTGISESVLRSWVRLGWLKDPIFKDDGIYVRLPDVAERAEREGVHRPLAQEAPADPQAAIHSVFGDGDAATVLACFKQNPNVALHFTEIADATGLKKGRVLDVINELRSYKNMGRYIEPLSSTVYLYRTKKVVRIGGRGIEAEGEETDTVIVLNRLPDGRLILLDEQTADVHVSRPVG